MITSHKKRIDLLSLDPSHTLILGFALLILFGAFILMLPVSTVEGHHLTFVNALFEATSAVCVTGLAVVDTGTTFTTFGQIVLLFLIQIGGWGFMTTSVFMFILFGKKIGLQERLLLQNSLNQFNLQGIVKLVVRIILITIITEAIGALVLAIRWSQDMPWSKVVYYSIFHSVSAFNNAGFGLEPDSLSKWATDPIINLVITGLFIIGGIGFTVIMEILEKKSFRKLSLHTKLTLIVTLLLNVIATVVIFALEYDNPNTMGSLDLSGKLWASYFQGVVPRTAGFNTIDISQMTLSSQVFLIGLMFIGASSASTGGGIKVTTFALIMIAFLTILSNKTNVNIFRRRMAWDQVNRAMSIGISAVIFVFIIFFLLTITEKATMIETLFETVSAFGTVGLSVGLTGKLTVLGRILITIMMFIGRIGPLTMAYALMRSEKGKSIRYAEEKILIG